MKIMYEVSYINADWFGLDGGAMYGVVPKTMWDKIHPADNANRIKLATRILIIKGNNRIILVDSGVGIKANTIFKDRYAVNQANGGLVENLKKIGIKKEEVTDVILSHLHFDHAGGLTYYEDSKTISLTFPNATHYAQRSQYEWGLNPPIREKASFMQDDFVPIEKSKKLKLLDGSGELFPGIVIMVSDGHTKGMQLTKVTSSNGTIVHCADLIPLHSHIRLSFSMAYDVAPLVQVEEKKKLLEQASANDWILFFEHDPLVASCKVKKTEKGYEPISYSL